MKKKILLIGGSGFIGSAIKNKINPRKFNLFCPSSSKLNLLNLNNVKSEIKKFRPDIIINAGAKIGGINYNKLYPQKVLFDNLRMQLNIFEVFLKSNSSKLYNLCSSCLYSAKNKKPAIEAQAIIGDLHQSVRNYGFSKLFSIYANENNKKKQICNLVLANVYGPNDNFESINSHFIPSAINKIFNAKKNKLKKIKFWGSGNEIRDYIYIDDVATIITKIILKNKKIKTLNIGSGLSYRNKDVVKIIKKLLDYDGEVIWNRKINPGAAYKVINCHLLKKFYKLEPKIQLKEGLQNTLKYYEKMLSL